MITIYETFEETNKNDLFDMVDAVLTKRNTLWEKYSRGIDFSTEGGSDEDLQILFEKFVVDMGAGYLSGEITYDVDVSSDVEKTVGSRIFGKTPVDEKYAAELRYIINTLAVQNDDANEETTLFRQALLYGSTYERIIEEAIETTEGENQEQNNGQSKLKYMNLDALNTVAVWDNSVEPKLLAVVSAFEVKEGTTTKQYYRVYTDKQVLVYSRETKSEVNDQKLTLNEEKDHNWGEVPVAVYESNFNMLDRCASLITAYESLLNNVRDTYQYNAEDCKMKIVGYRAQNPIMIPNPKYDPNKDGEENRMMLNPARIAEDNYVLSGKTFYVEQQGDADWLVKPVNASDVTTLLKYYVDSIFQMCGIPNTADLAFNSGDLNASAIDRKFYVMNIITSEIKDGITQLIMKRFEMLLKRINLKFNTKYDMANVRINIATNLPSMTDETIDQMMRLNGILSEETILEKLGYDYETESTRKENEDAKALGKARPTNNETDEETDEEQEGDNGGDSSTSEDDEETNKEVQSDSKE